MKFDPRARESIGLGLLVIAAFALRVWDLPVPGITHPEAYAPGIDFPSFVQNPIARHTFTDIVRSTLGTDNHPPGYYFFMLPWTDLFGTSLTVLRLPSAIIGALTVPLLFAALKRTEGGSVATLSATWLAFHGHHVFWSTQARMWVMCTALVVLSVWAATKLRERYHPGWAAVYLASVVSGLWIEYNFWPIFAAQIVWEIAARLRAGRMAPTIVLQGVALVLASPVLAFLFSQLGSSSYLKSSVFEHLLYTAAFGRWFETDAILEWVGLERSLYVALALCGAILMALGVREGLRRVSSTIDDTPSPRYLEWMLWLSILLPVSFMWRWGDLFHGRRYEAIALAAPPALVVGYHLASRHWSTVRTRLSGVFGAGFIHSIVSDACVMHSLAPLLLLSVVHLRVPSLAPRGLLASTPFLLVLASRGLNRLVRSPRARQFALVTVAVLGVISSASYRVPPPPRDYKGLATAIEAARKPGDVLVIEDAWYAQPLHYYLRPDMMMSYEHAALGTPDGRARFNDYVERAWLVGFGSDPRKRVRELSQLLTGYRELQFVSAFKAGAVLLERER